MRKLIIAFTQFACLSSFELCNLKAAAISSEGIKYYWVPSTPAIEELFGLADERAFPLYTCQLDNLIVRPINIVEPKVPREFSRCEMSVLRFSLSSPAPEASLQNLGSYVSKDGMELTKAMLLRRVAYQSSDGSQFNLIVRPPPAVVDCSMDICRFVVTVREGRVEQLFCSEGFKWSPRLCDGGISVGNGSDYSSPYDPLATEDTSSALPINSGPKGDSSSLEKADGLCMLNPSHTHTPSMDSLWVLVLTLLAIAGLRIILSRSFSSH